MIEHGKVILSDDIKEKFFVCNLEKCKGACCVEGDLGAPLELDELKKLEDAYEAVKPYLMEEGIAAIEKEGKYVLDEDGEYSTTTIGGAECAYAVYDDKGILKCGIEEAYNDGKTDFKKPISCHLYPIRAKKYDEFEALNYDRWHICNPACDFGKELGVEIYKFLKDPLIRKYGEQWYNELVELIEKGEE
ncbi:DUF3109 family protein [Fulvivirga lutea]|uniref:DUF3109 family protein n=1 Tax=Fulvivirga lutea TaxID=2810512 RepID=A0A975A044_9BACT|nr:DUF3109 family protein [Fulvivirga lutea]QSE96999.1 DUF3109 family protein [Fulvivirga lutea]